MPSKTYKQFVSDLNNSQLAVLALAAFLQRKEKGVILPPHKVTPTEEERYNYQDEADLLTFDSLGDLSSVKKHQVKNSSRDFSSVEGFGFKMVTVDESYKIAYQEDYPPIAYWIVNKSRTGAIYIPWDTKQDWDTFSQIDKFQGGRECEFRRCPAKLCKYLSFK